MFTNQPSNKVDQNFANFLLLVNKCLNGSNGEGYQTDCKSMVRGKSLKVLQIKKQFSDDQKHEEDDKG